MVFELLRFPEPQLSGWNCTPSMGMVLWRTARIAGRYVSGANGFLMVLIGRYR